MTAQHNKLASRLPVSVEILPVMTQSPSLAALNSNLPSSFEGHYISALVLTLHILTQDVCILIRKGLNGQLCVSRTFGTHRDLHAWICVELCSVT